MTNVKEQIQAALRTKADVRITIRTESEMIPSTWQISVREPKSYDRSKPELENTLTEYWAATRCNCGSIPAASHHISTWTA